MEILNKYMTFNIYPKKLKHKVACYSVSELGLHGRVKKIERHERVVNSSSSS